MKDQIQIAAKLYHIRDTAKRFFGADFKTKLEPYMSMLNTHMINSGKGEIEAVSDLVQLKSVEDNGMAQMMFFAAAVEKIEPST